jgi:hypothetical protein
MALTESLTNQITAHGTPARSECKPGKIAKYIISLSDMLWFESFVAM